MIDIDKLIKACVLGKGVVQTVLKLRGWLADEDREFDWKEIIEAVQHYQRFHGLAADGWVGSQTRRSFEQPRYCQRDRLAFSGQGALCRWNHSPVTWASAVELPGWRHDDLLEVFHDAFEHIAEHCALRFRYVEDPTQANIGLIHADIDGSGQVLADMQLPCGNVQRVQGRFDRAENFAATQNPAPGQQNIKQVARHEFLHGVGVFHRENRPPGSPPTLMDPFVSEARLIGPWEKNQLQLRYPGEGQPAPGIDTTPTEGQRLVIEFQNARVLPE